MCTRSCNYWRLSGFSQTQYGSGHYYATHSIKSQPVSLVAFDWITKNYYIDTGKKSRIDILILRVKLIVSNGTLSTSSSSFYIIICVAPMKRPRAPQKS